ncbi:MAG TPA: hypothetical protein VM713_07640 [Steroidobacteraceae bacterium]|nr:hypothetical protein [Steroidobacteraceae bacterium]
MLETIFGPTISLSTGRVIPTRRVGEHHFQQHLGFIPSFADWMRASGLCPRWAVPARLEDRPHRAATLPADSGERRDQS